MLEYCCFIRYLLYAFPSLPTQKSVLEFLFLQLILFLYLFPFFSPNSFSSTFLLQVISFFLWLQSSQEITTSEKKS
jgi:hypothetical protein